MDLDLKDVGFSFAKPDYAPKNPFESIRSMKPFLPSSSNATGNNYTNPPVRNTGSNLALVCDNDCSKASWNVPLLSFPERPSSLTKHFTSKIPVIVLSFDGNSYQRLPWSSCSLKLTFSNHFGDAECKEQSYYTSIAFWCTRKAVFT